VSHLYLLAFYRVAYNKNKKIYTMDPDQDWERAPCVIQWRTGDFQVQAFELILILFWNFDIFWNA